jgi:hypothetical protein
MPIIDIRNPHSILPSILLLDTSMLLYLRTPVGTPNAREMVIRQFLNRISREAAANQVMCFASLLTFEECYFKIIETGYRADLPSHEIRLKTSLGKSHVGWHDLYKDMPMLIRNYMPTIQNFHAVVQAIPIVAIEPEDLVSRRTSAHTPRSMEESMRYYIDNVPILPKDAYLISVAERVGIPHFATLDRDFSSISWLNVYTIP